MSDIAYDWYIRTPFAVEAIKITEENLDEVAKLVGVAHHKGDQSYISLDRRIVPNVSRAQLGWYLTRFGDNLRCYAPAIFEEQFINMPEEQPVTFLFEYGGEDDSTVSVIEPNEGIPFEEYEEPEPPVRLQVD